MSKGIYKHVVVQFVLDWFCRMVCVLQEREDANLSDWDRFARTEYIRLAMEEEGEEAEPESSNDLWESSVTEVAFA